MPVEKNDVNVDRLFAWSRESSIIGKDGKEMKIFLRLLGDADINRARVLSLRKSAELRKALKTENSDERLAYIPSRDELNKDILQSSVVALTMRELTQQVIRDIVVKRPKDPSSDATTEELEKYQKEVDEYPAKRDVAIRAELEKLVNRRKDELEKESEDNLYGMYLSALIKELCEQELLKRFKEYCVFFGTYTDKKLTKRLFTDFNEFDNIPSGLKEKLITEYSLIEIESEELKK